MDLIYRAGIGLAKATYRFLGYELDVKGEENLPKDPYIIAANHISVADIAAIMVAVDKVDKYRHVRFIAKPHWTKGFVGFLLGGFRPISVNDLHELENLKKDREILAIFPEGTRSVNREIGKFKRGVRSISNILELPVVPTYIGGDNPWIKGNRLPPIVKNGVSRIIFGKHITPRKNLENEVRDAIIKLGAYDAYS